MLVRNLLLDTHSHLPPAATLAGLSNADAARRVGGVPHSIAEIVAHMAFWQDWFRHRCEGGTDPAAVTAALGWPEVAEDAWPDVRDGFVAGLERLAHVVEQLEPDLPLVPALGMPMLEGYTARDVWEHVGQHNAHHLGQVVILRQFLGVWPPPAGSFTW
jgi:uncharacterized damage-inducible protein DinB